eukprot:3281749-Pleurochrysis_carterae.AAC.1
MRVEPTKSSVASGLARRADASVARGGREGGLSPRCGASAHEARGCPAAAVEWGAAGDAPWAGEAVVGACGPSCCRRRAAGEAEGAARLFAGWEGE